MKIKMMCQECKYEPSPNKEKSNKNWKVYDNICPNCGGRMSLKVVNK